MNENNPFPYYPDLPECDDFEERAAIMEYDGGLTREASEIESARIVGVSLELVRGTAAPERPEVREYRSETTGRTEQTRPEGAPAKWVFTGRELLDMPLTKPPCLIDPVLQTTSFSLLLGESDIGKTWLALGILLAVASGESEWLGYPIIATHRRVILISTEDSEFNLAGRFRVLQDTFDRVAWQDHVTVLIADDKSNAEIIAEIKKIIAVHPVDLIIADCFGDLFDGRDGNSQADARRFYKQFAGLAKLCHFMLVHHKGKRTEDKTPSKNHSLGSQAIEAKARTVFDLTEVKGKFYLSVLKCKTSRDVKKHSKRLEFDEKLLVFRDTGETILRSQIGAEEGPSLDWVPLFRSNERLKRSNLAQSYMDVTGLSRSAAFARIKTAIERGDLRLDDFGNIMNPSTLVTSAEEVSSPSSPPRVVDGLDKPGRKAPAGNPVRTSKTPSRRKKNKVKHANEAVQSVQTP